MGRVRPCPVFPAPLELLRVINSQHLPQPCHRRHHQARAVCQSGSGGGAVIHLFLGPCLQVEHPPGFFDCPRQGEEHGYAGRLSLSRAAVTLLLMSIFVAFMSEILVGAVEETAKALDMPQVYIGIVVPAVVGGAAESSSAVVLGEKTVWISALP